MMCRGTFHVCHGGHGFPPAYRRHVLKPEVTFGGGQFVPLDRDRRRVASRRVRGTGAAVLASGIDYVSSPVDGDGPEVAVACAER